MWSMFKKQYLCIFFDFQSDFDDSHIRHQMCHAALFPALLLANVKLHKCWFKNVVQYQSFVIVFDVQLLFVASKCLCAWNQWGAKMVLIYSFFIVIFNYLRKKIKEKRERKKIAWNSLKPCVNKKIAFKCTKCTHRQAEIGEGRESEIIFETFETKIYWKSKNFVSLFISHTHTTLNAKWFATQSFCWYFYCCHRHSNECIGSVL